MHHAILTDSFTAAIAEHTSLFSDVQHVISMSGIPPTSARAPLTASWALPWYIKAIISPANMTDVPALSALTLGGDAVRVCVIGSLNDTNRPRVWAILASSCPAIKRSCIIDNTHTHYIYNRQAHTQTVLLISVCVCVCATDGGGAVADQYVFSRSDCIIIILMTAVFPLADGLRDKQGNSGGL